MMSQRKWVICAVSWNHNLCQSDTNHSLKNSSAQIVWIQNFLVYSKLLLAESKCNKVCNLKWNFGNSQKSNKFFEQIQSYSFVQTAMFLHLFYCKSFFFCLLLWCERFCLKQNKSLLGKGIFHQILYRPNMLRTLVTPANFFLLNFADTGSACSNVEYEQSIDDSSTNASTLSVSVFVFVRVYACLCFCPFMCVLHLKYTYRSTFVFGCTMHYAWPEDEVFMGTFACKTTVSGK